MTDYLDKVHFGDCRTSLRAMAAAGVKVQMCVTSPPYFGLRDYGHEGQIGLEETPEQFIAELVEVFRCVRSVLADDGTLWINIGDSYNAHPGQRKTTDAAGGKQQSMRGSTGTASRSVEGIKAKDLIGIPWMLAFALRADGWYLRQEIIWHKPNPMPESVTDRCTKAHESLFLLAKSPKYFIDPLGLKEPAIGASLHDATGRTKQRGMADTFKRTDSKREQAIPGQAVGTHRFDREESSYDLYTRNKRSVWTIPTKPYKGAHFAVFPSALVEPCILAGSRPGDVVLDCFMGSGTSAAVAIQHGRQFIGCELNADYGPLQNERIAAARVQVIEAEAERERLAAQMNLFGEAA